MSLYSKIKSNNHGEDDCTGHLHPCQRFVFDLKMWQNMKRYNIPSLGPHHDEMAVERKSLFTYGKFEDNVRAAPVRAALHRHPFQEVAVFTEGEGSYMADFNDYEITAPCAVLIPSGVAHQWPDTESLKGHIIAFDLEFLAAVSRSTGPASILRPPVPVVIELQDEALVQAITIIQSIAHEYAGECLHGRDAIRSHLSLLLIQLRRIHDQSASSKFSTMDSLYSDFLDYLELNWQTDRSAKSIASALNVSADHLAATLKKACGKNTSALIHERVLLEAKRLLCHSRMSVSEIAYDLGYEDASYFTRFFKKHVEMTPKDFRAKFQ